MKLTEDQKRAIKRVKKFNILLDEAVKLGEEAEAQIQALWADVRSGKRQNDDTFKAELAKLRTKRENAESYADEYDTKRHALAEHHNVCFFDDSQLVAMG